MVVNAIILLSGRTYIYRGIAHTYMKGRTGPGIQDQDIFENKKIVASAPQPWKLHSMYNEGNLSETTASGFAQTQTTSFLVIQDDSILFEKYWDGVNESTITNSFSVAKSIVSVLIGVALQEGKIKSLDQPVKDFLPSFAEDGKEIITIRHLLMMSSGLNWSESGGNPFSDNAEAYFGTDLEGQITDLERIEEPGKEFKYLSGNSQVLAFVLKIATGESVSNLAAKDLWGPLGAESDALWNLDKVGGNEKAFCCFYATARDFCRIGKLYLNGGAWNGKQIVPAEYVALSCLPAPILADGAPNIRYGLHWWTENYKNLDFFYARGINGQYIIVVPEKDIIVFRAGHMRLKNNERGHPEDLYQYVDAALELVKE